MFGLEGKRQVTMVISLSIAKNLFPPQIMFIGSTFMTLPPNNNGKTSCVNNGWDLIFIENHWSSLETTKKFVKKILLPYL
jgi:hypothetical protein